MFVPDGLPENFSYGQVCAALLCNKYASSRCIALKNRVELVLLLYRLDVVCAISVRCVNTRLPIGLSSPISLSLVGLVFSNPKAHCASLAHPAVSFTSIH